MLDRYLNDMAAARSRQRALALDAVRTPADLGTWQAGARARLTAVLRGYPARTPLRPRTIEVLDGRGYSIEKVLYESRPRTFVPANVYVPRPRAGPGPPWPAVVVSCGHTEVTGKAYRDYQRLCIELARRGYLALILDPWGQGERRQYWDPAAGAPAVPHEHLYVAYQALLVGQSFARYRVWDKVRAIDYLCARPDVDATRLGCAGHSGGGAMAVLMAAVDPRLLAVATSGAGGPCEWAQLPPGGRYSAHVEDGIADAVSLFAPRPFLIACGERDGPRLSWLRPAASQLEGLYGAVGAGERFRFALSGGGHELDARQRGLLLRWLDRWLKPAGSGATEDGASGDGAGPEERDSDERDLLPVERLWCTPGGDVSALPGSVPLAAHLRRAARRLARERRRRREEDRAGAGARDGTAAGEGAPHRVVTRLRQVLQWDAIPAPTSPPEALVAGAPPAASWNQRRTGGGAGHLVLPSEPGIELPALSWRPPGTDPGASPLLVWLDERGKEAVLRVPGEPGQPGGAGGTEGVAPDSVAGVALGAGWAVLAVDTRGLGATRSREVETGKARGMRSYLAPLGTDAANGLRSIVLGRPLIGMRVFDALRAVAYARALPAQATRPLVLAGYGGGGIVALLGAALGEGIAGAVSWRALATYDSLVRHSLYGFGAGLFAAGLLAQVDLPEIVEAIAGGHAPRPLLLIDPLDHRGLPLPAGRAARIYGRPGAGTGTPPAGLTLLHTPPGDEAPALAGLARFLKCVAGAAPVERDSRCST